MTNYDILENSVELDAPTDPKAAEAYFIEARLEALTADPPDWARYNLAGRRLVELIQERPLR